MTKEEIEELNREFAEMRSLVQQLSSLSIKVHEAAEKALTAFGPERIDNASGQ